MADDRYEIIWWRGVRLDRYTVDRLLWAEQRCGIRIEPTQGSYNKGGVGQSKGTHDGGGAVDIKVRHLSRKQANAICKALREAGFAAWIRETLPGVWAIHIHAILVGNTKVSDGAASQVSAYRKRPPRNGLANNGPDDFPWHPGTVRNAPYGHATASAIHQEDDMPYTPQQLEQHVANGVASALEGKQATNRIRKIVWGLTTVKRGNGRIQALQELADTKTLQVETNAKLDRLIALLEGAK